MLEIHNFLISSELLSKWLMISFRQGRHQKYTEFFETIQEISLEVNDDK